MTARIYNQAIFDWFGNVRADVELTEEREAHIAERHPDDFTRLKGYIIKAIEDPDVILADSRSPMTAMFIGVSSDSSLNVVVRLCLAEKDASRSFVVTMHAIGQKRLKRLMKKYPVLYKSESTWYTMGEPK